MNYKNRKVRGFMGRIGVISVPIEDYIKAKKESTLGNPPGYYSLETWRDFYGLHVLLQIYYGYFEDFILIDSKVSGYILNNLKMLPEKERKSVEIFFSHLNTIKNDVYYSYDIYIE